MINYLWLLVISIVSMLMFIITGYYINDEYQIVVIEEKKSIISLIFCYFFAIVAIVSLILIFIIQGAGKDIYEKEPYSVEKLVALHDNNLTGGRYYCHRGYIEETMWYQYMVDIGGGAMTMNKIKANGTKIYYSDKPRVKWYKGRKVWWIFYNNSIPTKQELYIPEGTLKEDYSIDLQ